MMNYFELYGLPECFTPDIGQVKAKYYELSRQYHPDRFAQSNDSNKAEAMRMAAINNDAWKTLSNSYETMAYILKQHGLLEDEEKYSLPPAFLVEMMDLNEAVSEYEAAPSDAALHSVVQMIESQMQQWQDEVRPLTESFDKGEQGRDLLLKIKDYYFRKKYLLRIQQRINTFAAR